MRACKVGVITLLLSLMTSGCMSVPQIPANVSPEGANILSGGTFAGVLYLRSILVLPGRSNISGVVHMIDCHGNSHEIKIALHGDLSDGGEEYCRAARSALDYIVAIHPKSAASIELHLAPVGQHLWMRRWSLSTRLPRMHLVAPVFDDEDRTLGNIVAVVAHESFHLPWFKEGDERAGDERAAHWAGICAQLATRGRLGPEALLSDALDSTDAEVIASSGAALAVRRELETYVGSSGLAVGSAGAEHLRRQCGQEGFPVRAYH